MAQPITPTMIRILTGSPQPLGYDSTKPHSYDQNQSVQFSFCPVIKRASLVTTFPPDTFTENARRRGKGVVLGSV